jgi:hypothetical protein
VLACPVFGDVTFFVVGVARVGDFGSPRVVERRFPVTRVQYIDIAV